MALRHPRLAGSILASLCLGGICTAGAGSLVEARDDRRAVRVRQESACCPSEILVEVLDSRGQSSFDFTARVERLEGVHLVAGEGSLVHGALRYGGDALVVLNLDELSVESEIWSYGFHPSPSASQMVYQTHYPRQVAPQARRSILLLYDLRVTAEVNRRGDPLSGWPRPNLGRPLFPRIHACQTSHDVTLGDEYVVSSPVLWSPTESRIVFFVQNKTKQVSSLVRVDVDDPCGGTVVRELDLEKLAAEKRARDPRSFAAESLQWTDEAATRIQVVPQAASPFPPKMIFEVP